MAQSGYTPILIYGSSTASNVPLAANLTTSASGVELAINAADGKLYYKDSGGVVQVLATKGAGTIGGSNTQVQYNNAGALAGSANFTFNGTTVTMANDASISGLTVGKGGGSVSTNTAVGASALAANSTGYNIAAFGNQALTSNTGNGNSAFGSVALFTNTSGTENSAFGLGAMYSNTTGVNNSSVGRNSLNSNSTGSYNVAVGHSSLNANTTASNNTAVGYQAGYTNSTGVANTFFGNQAGYSSNYNGVAVNCCIGSTAGYSLSTGNNNTFVGSSASGYYVTTGSFNTIVGAYNGNQGGIDIRTASNNTVLSDGSGYIRYAAYGVSITTASTRLASTCGVGTMVWFSGYNTSNGAQGWWLVAATTSTGVTTISSSNGTGLTVTFTQSSGSIFASTSSGTIAGMSYMFVN